MSAEQLTTGFFHAFSTGTVPPGTHPVLQILEYRKVAMQNGARETLRCRLSDGAFSSAYCMGNADIAERFEEEGLMGTKAIIQIHEYSRTVLNDKPCFHILDFSVRSFPRGTIGEPRPHTGDPNEFRGIENFAQAKKAEEELTAMDFPSRKRANGGPMGGGSFKKANNASGGVFDPLIGISAITPFMSTFRICGLASGKEEKRTINTKRGPSMVFSFVLTDEQGDAIKITGFGNEVEKFWDMIENGKAYYVHVHSGGTVREANKRFNSTGHSYEITLNAKCDVEPCNDRHITEVAIKLHPIKLIEIKNHSKECVDVFAVVKRCDDAQQIVSKAGKQLTKRDIVLVDDSMVEVRLTLWEEQAINAGQLEEVGSVVAIKGASVREFNGGFTLSCGSATNISFVDNEETRRLAEWFRNKPENAEFGSLQGNLSNEAFERDYRLIRAVDKSQLVQNGDENGTYVVFKGMIQNIRTENCTYLACNQCRKKLAAEDNQYRCERCGPTDQPRVLYKLNVEIADFSGSVWMSFFDEAAKQLIGMEAGEFNQLAEQDRDAAEVIFQNLRIKTYELRVRAKCETYNEIHRVQYTCSGIRALNYDRVLQYFEQSLQALQTREQGGH